MIAATVVGARPQFIKAAVVSQAMKAQGQRELLIHTGQHYSPELSDVFFRELGIPAPEYNLGIGSGTHGAQTGRMLAAIEAVFLERKPGVVLVYGDTNSTLAGALAAVKLHIPVAHIEAGLRSFDQRMPEEVNRVVADHVSDLLFAPTVKARDNLRREGCDENRIRLVGDVMYDAALRFGNKAEAESRILSALDLRPQGYVLATVHRAENTDAPARVQAIFDGLIGVARETPVLLPLHPRTRKVLEQQGKLGEVARRLQVIPPLGYLDMMKLQRNARMVVTDSGGLQKEAFFHGVPCVTLREGTEWVELVDLGWNHLVPPTSGGAVEAGIRKAMAAPAGRAATPYGDGHSAERIVKEILHEYGSTP